MLKTVVTIYSVNDCRKMSMSLHLTTLSVSAFKFVDELKKWEKWLAII